MIDLPSVLSLQRGTIVTDGIMYSLKEDGSIEPVRVIRHGIRGVMYKDKGDSVSNIQRTESAKTCKDAIGLQVKFAYRAIDAREILFACNDTNYRKAFEQLVEELFIDQKRSAELDEVCLRYARNILNGRWLWRNRVLGKVSVTATHDGDEYSGEGSTTAHFENYTEDEKRLANVIKYQLRGDDDTPINVCGRVEFGFTGEVEVFPSQNMVSYKPDGFARSLYKVDPISRRQLLSALSVKNGSDAGEFYGDMIDMGIAALRDQKIGNAIRTIDTWYPDYTKVGEPISVEPNGENIGYNTSFRENYATNLLAKINERNPNEAFDSDVAYLIALIIRGGVFGKGDDKGDEEKASGRRAKGKGKGEGDNNAD